VYRHMDGWLEIRHRVLREGAGKRAEETESTRFTNAREAVWKSDGKDDFEFPSRLASKNQSNQTHQSPVAEVKSLIPQERRVFQLCFQTGFLSYRDIASHLDITPTAAKNLVNRIFQSGRKRPLFTKQLEHGAVRVGLPPELQRQILAGGKPGERKKRTSLASLAR
jgi:hypothetical protein